MSIFKKILKKADLIQPEYRPPGPVLVPSQHQIHSADNQYPQLPGATQVPSSHQQSSTLLTQTPPYGVLTGPIAQPLRPIKTYVVFYPSKWSAYTKVMAECIPGGEAFSHDTAVSTLRPVLHFYSAGMTWITITVRSQSEAGPVLATAKPKDYGGGTWFTLSDDRDAPLSRMKDDGGLGGAWTEVRRDGWYPLKFRFAWWVEVEPGRRERRELMWCMAQGDDDALGASSRGRDFKLLDVTNGGDGTGAAVLATWISNQHPLSEKGLSGRLHFYAELGELELPAVVAVMALVDERHRNKS